MRLFAVAATLVLLVHLAYLAWVLLGWIWTRGRRLLTWLHIGSLVWGIVVEFGPWPCPLTLLEERLESRAGIASYQGSFILHYVDVLVYPNLPYAVVAWLGAGACAAILLIYLRRALAARGR